MKRRHVRNQGTSPRERFTTSSAPPWPAPRRVRVMAENAPFVEGDAAVGRQIGCDIGMLRDRSARAGPRIGPARGGDRLREGVAQARPSLEQRQVGIGERGADEMLWPAGLRARTRSK